MPLRSVPRAFECPAPTNQRDWLLIRFNQRSLCRWPRVFLHLQRGQSGFVCIMCARRIAMRGFKKVPACPEACSPRGGGVGPPKGRPSKPTWFPIIPRRPGTESNADGAARSITYRNTSFASSSYERSISTLFGLQAPSFKEVGLRSDSTFLDDWTPWTPVFVRPINLRGRSCHLKSKRFTRPPQMLIDDGNALV